ncbi:hypothetical protein PtB15_18B67 [Puccinia triticina]|nr:hypothetical protein PtB15_18B67 [Puccinia triticina]
MLLNTPKSLLLLHKSDLITFCEGSQPPNTRLGSRATLISTPLKPSVLRTAKVKSIIQRNHYRQAKVELGLCLLLDSDPMRDVIYHPSLPSGGHQSSSSTGNYWLDCSESESSISFNDPNDIPSHLYNSPRLFDNELQSSILEHESPKISRPFKAMLREWKQSGRPSHLPLCSIRTSFMPVF